MKDSCPRFIEKMASESLSTPMITCRVMSIVFKADGEVIIQLGSETETAFIDQIHGGISNREIAKALQIVQLNQTKLLSAWKSIHG